MHPIHEVRLGHSEFRPEPIPIFKGRNSPGRREVRKSPGPGFRIVWICTALAPLSQGLQA